MSAAGHTVDGVVSVNWLCKLLIKEIETPGLQALTTDTFQKVATAIAHLQGQGFDGMEASVRDRLVELMSESSKILIRARLRKILSNSESLDYSKLTDEEKYILDGKNDAEDRIEEIFSAVKGGRLKVLESACAKARSKKVIIRFVKPMEQFVGVDMTKYGPYIKEDVASLPLENARSFITTGIAIEVHASIS
jgi:DNA replication factor GINS